MSASLQKKSSKMLCYIPARGGSKRIPGKNKALLAGKPLITYTIETAKKAAVFDRIVVSSDDDEILKIAKDSCVDIHKRPAELAGDKVTVAEALAEYLKDNPHENVMVLFPTSPLRNIDDIKACAGLLDEKGVFVVSVSRFDFPVHLAMNMDESGKLHKTNPGAYEKSTQSQAHEPMYHPNGSIYAFKMEDFMQQCTLVGEPGFGYLMPPERSIDIDEPIDMKLAELMIKNG